MQGDKTRKRMVVEEVGSGDAVNPETVEEIKEKVEELQNITENISESVEKSADIQEDLAKVVEEVAPVMPVEVARPVMEERTPDIKNGNGPNPLMIIVPGIFLLGALLGGIVFYQKGMMGGTARPTPTSPDYSNTATTPAPTSVAQTKLDLTKYPINVMNGSGTPGQAGTVKDLLVAAGFTVSGTGNAPSYNFTKTVIKAKVDVPAAFLTQLTVALSKSYVVDTNQSLATSSADSVQVIVGSTKTN